MKKFLSILTISLFLLSGSLAMAEGKHYGWYKKGNTDNSINTGDIGSNNTNNGIIAGGDVGSDNTTTNSGIIAGGDVINNGIVADGDVIGGKGGKGGKGGIGVGVGLGGDATIEGGAVNVETTIEGNSYQAAPIPGSVGYGPVLNYFGQPLPSEGFQPVEQLIMYSCWFTNGTLKSMLKGVEDAEAEFKVANVGIADASPAAEDGKTKWIKVVISRTKYEGQNVGFKGFITARSDDKRTTMTEVMAKAALIAVENGCNVIHFTAQGAVRDIMSSGWGIGFNTTAAHIYSDDLTRSNVTSGGMGYSSAKAGVRDLPWLQGFGLVDNDLTYPVLLVAAAPDNEVIINGKKQTLSE